MSDFVKDTNVHINDSISRQAAIDATRNATFSFTIKSDTDFANYRKEIQEIFNNVLDAQEKALNELPSAQQERMCYGCRYERHGSVVCDSCSRFFLDRYEVDNNG